MRLTVSTAQSTILTEMTKDDVTFHLDLKKTYLRLRFNLSKETLNYYFSQRSKAQYMILMVSARYCQFLYIGGVAKVTLVIY